MLARHRSFLAAAIAAVVAAVPLPTVEADPADAAGTRASAPAVAAIPGASAPVPTVPAAAVDWVGAAPVAMRGPLDVADIADDWTWPVAPPVLVIAAFLAPPTPYSAGHRGIDIATTVDADVIAPAPGVVTFAGPVAGRDVIAIDHGDGLVSAIEPVSAAVDVGAPVGAGDRVGVVTTGGHCDGRCVHFGVRLHGEYVSPLLVLGGVPRAVLLPLR